MEEFINKTRGFLGVLQSILTGEEKERSAQAAQEMYDEITKVVQGKDLNFREMLNAAIAVQVSILEIAVQQMNEIDKEGK